MVSVGVFVLLSFLVGVLVVFVANIHRHVVVIVVIPLPLLGVGAMLIVAKNL